MAKPASVRDFESALASLPRPRGRQPLFLRAHAEAKGRALNMRAIAKAARYAHWRAGNLQYGLLAERIGREMGRSKEGFGLLVEFIPPKRVSKDKNISNDEWILVMRPNFAKALIRSGWIKSRGVAS
jgi:hypothetical protein